MTRDDLLAELEAIHAESQLQPGDLTIRKIMAKNPDWTRGHTITILNRLVKKKNLKKVEVLNENGRREIAWRK